MDKIKSLTSIFEGGMAPENYDGKAVKKLVKIWNKLENPRVVKLYPIRRVAHEGWCYCVYACPFKGTEIDEQTLQSITSLVNEVEVGHIRYDSAMATWDYFKFTDNGTHVLDRDRNAITDISDHFDNIILYSNAATSSKKVAQLDCHYAIIGLEEQPDLYHVRAIPNSTIGEVTKDYVFLSDDEPTKDQMYSDKDDEPASPAEEKVRSAFMVLSAIITIGALIWYFILPLLNKTM